MYVSNIHIKQALKIFLFHRKYLFFQNLNIYHLYYFE
jgi:hypothetical protein